MSGTTTTLDVSAQDLGVIETALHTQVKILDVQAGAGGAEARLRLNEVKSVLALVDQKRRREAGCNGPVWAAWFGLTRLFCRKATA